MPGNSFWVIFAITFFFIRGIAASNNSSCPSGTFEYKGQSCYLFLGKTKTARLNNIVWQLPKKGVDGMTRGRLSVSLESCIWNKDHALDACRDAHLSSPDLAHLANYSELWNLPALETEEEDNWLHDMTVQLQGDIGTSFWIDLIDKFNEKSWGTTNELADFVRYPLGIDRWWERANVQMMRVDDEETMCYEFHIDYEATRETKHRKPYLPMKVRGWHPRACREAYDQESDLDSADDFTKLEIVDAESYWRMGLAVGYGYECSFGDDNYCIIPEVKTDDGGRAKCDNQVEKMYLRGKYRMRLAPIGVVCELDINNLREL